MFLSIGLATILVLYIILKRLRMATSSLPQTAPATIPIISNVLAFVLGGSRLRRLFQPYFNATVPVRFNLGIVNIFLIVSPRDIRAIDRQPHSFSDCHIRARFIRNVFGVPLIATNVVKADNSGSKHVPLEGSTVHPSRRIIYRQQRSTFDALLAPEVIGVFVSHVADFMDRAVTASRISGEWEHYSNLFTFTRDLASTAILNALCGPRLLERDPKFIESFWIFDANIHWLHLGMPRWLRGEAYAARTSCLDAIMEWQRWATRESTDTVDENGPLWNDVWGMKIMRDRKIMYDQFPEFRAEARAGSDLGLIWACMDNLVPIAYWLLYVLLSSPERLATFRCSIDTARLSSKHEGLPRFDVGKLAQDAYLCSLLHEVLRVHVTSLIARRVEQDVEIGENQLPKGSIALVAPWIQHRNTARCERGLGMEKHSVHEFWGERFLSEGKGGPEFSKKAAGVAFMAFGMGTHRCPGRRFATGAILSIVATLISVFEFAPPEREDWPHAELRHSTFGYTPARPAEPVQFRVRKRDT